MWYFFYPFWVSKNTVEWFPSPASDDRAEKVGSLNRPAVFAKEAWGIPLYLPGFFMSYYFLYVALEQQRFSADERRC